MNWKEQFNQAVKRQSWQVAEMVLLDFFKTEVAKNPALLKELFAMRLQIKAKKHRFLTSELFAHDEATAIKAFGAMGGDLLNLLDPKNYSIPKPLKNLSWEPDNDDLAKLLGPHLGTDLLRMSMLGVHYGEGFITATDAHTLFFYPDNPVKKKGTYCMTKKCFDFIGKDTIDTRFPDVKQVIPTIEENNQGHVLNAAEWYKLISLLEDNGIDSLNGKFPVGSFKSVQGGDVLVNLSMLKACLKSFLLLGEEEILVFFNGPSKALVITPKRGFNRVALNKYRILLILFMPLLNTGEVPGYQINFELNQGTFGMEASKQQAKIPGVGTTQKSPIESAIEALKTAAEFAEASAKKELSSAIEALQVALEFA